MTFDIDRSEMRSYILNKFNCEGDFEFMGDLLCEVLDLMLDTDAAYLAGLGEDEDYDDDAAYELLYAQIQRKYPDHKMYAMRLAEDYLDFQEEYLVSVDAIEWE